MIANSWANHRGAGGFDHGVRVFTGTLTREPCIYITGRLLLFWAGCGLSLAVNFSAFSRKFH
jgi:hypothetical protein